MHAKGIENLISRLGKEERDGESFDLLAHLQASVTRGSGLATEQLRTIENFDQDKAALFDKEVRDTLQIWENAFRELFSELDCDLDDFVLSDEFDELVSEATSAWADSSDLELGISIYPETVTLIFDSLRKSKIEIGPYGSQGSGEAGGDNYRITHYAENLALSPMIPRFLLWDISLGEFANDLSFFMASGGHLDTLPAYLVGICASPGTSLNLLKAINEIEPGAGRATARSNQVPGFCDYVKIWVQFPLLVNPVTDIWLLAKLEPANIANSFFNAYDEVQDMDEDMDNLEGGVLCSYNWDFLSVGMRKIVKLSQELSFDEDLFAAALLGQRIIEEFKCERARIEDHVNSESGIVRVVVFCSPNLESSAKQGVNQEDPVFKNQDFINLITSLWLRNDLSVVI